MNKNLSISILVLIILFHVFNNFIWLKANQEPPFDDDARHLLNGLTYMDIAASKPAGVMFKEFVGSFDKDYPPVFPFCAGIMSRLFGRSTLALKMGGGVFWVVLLLSVYFLALKLTNQTAALLSAFILSMYPAVFGFSRTHIIEFSLIAMVTLALYLLMCADEFHSRIYSVFFGLSFGLGMLTKVTFIAFIIGPLALTVVRSLKGSSEERKRPQVLNNLIISLLAAFAVAGLWYVPRLYNLSLWRGYVIDGGFTRALYLGSPPLFSFDSLAYYFKKLYNDQILPAFTLLFCISLIIFLKERTRFRHFLILWIIVPYFLLTLIYTKLVRYTASYLPAIAIITAIGILKIKNRKAKFTAISLIIIFDLLQYFVFSYGLSDKTNLLKFWKRPATYTLSPRRGNWQFDEIYSSIVESKNGAAATTVGLTYTRREEIKPEDFRENWLATNRLGWLYFIKLRKITNIALLNLDPEERLRFNVLPDFLIASEDISHYSTLVAAQKNGYKLLKQFVMPDQSYADVYKLIK